MGTPTLFLADATPTPSTEIIQEMLDLGKYKALANPYDNIREEVLVVTFCFILIGFIVSIYTNRNNPDGAPTALLRITIVTILISASPWLFPMIGEILYYFPRKLLLNANTVNAVGDRIRATLQDSLNNADKLMQKNPTSGNALTLMQEMGVSVMAYIWSGVLGLIGLIGSVVLLPFYFIQYSMHQLMEAFLPIFLGMFCIPATKNIAQTYTLMTISVYAWPLGFVATSLAAGSILDISSVSNSSINAGFGGLIAPATAATVLIMGTVFTPFFCFYVFTAGGVAPNVTNPVGSLARKAMSAGNTMMPGVKSLLK